MRKKTVRRSKPSAPSTTPRRSYLKQADVPHASLTDALRLPQAIFEHFAGRPTKPLQLARALNIDPKGSQFRVLSGAAMAFGMIEGGAQATSVSVTPLARRICRPTDEGADMVAKREAVLKPRMFREFLERYNGNQVPRPDIAVNVIEEMGVPHAKAEDVLGRILDSARSVGFLTEINTKTFVSLDADDPEAVVEVQYDAEVEDNAPTAYEAQDAPQSGSALGTKKTTLDTAVAEDMRRKKVFVTHGKNREFVEPIKQLLEYGEMEPVVSVERQSVSKPVPEKFMDDMRSAGAAIIHVDAERVVTERDGQEHVILNPNVLIEIGAAMAFYGRRFILLVKDGVRLPSNLQGLYEVRYSGDTLDASATLRLLNAVKDIKNHQLPNRDES